MLHLEEASPPCVFCLCMWLCVLAACQDSKIVQVPDGEPAQQRCTAPGFLPCMHAASAQWSAQLCCTVLQKEHCVCVWGGAIQPLDMSFNCFASTWIHPTSSAHSRNLGCLSVSVQHVAER